MEKGYELLMALSSLAVVCIKYQCTAYRGLDGHVHIMKWGIGLDNVYLAQIEESELASMSKIDMERYLETLLKFMPNRKEGANEQ